MEKHENTRRQYSHLQVLLKRKKKLIVNMSIIAIENKVRAAGKVN